MDLRFTQVVGAVMCDIALLVPSAIASWLFYWSIPGWVLSLMLTKPVEEIGVLTQLVVAVTICFVGYAWLYLIASKSKVVEVEPSSR